MSFAEEPEQIPITASLAKEMEVDWSCVTHHQQYCHELPSGGPLMAVEREADRKRHGGQWRKR